MVLKKEVKTGIIVTVALGMLIFGLNFLKGVNLFSHTKIIYAVYNDVQGVVPSNPIVVNGFHIGQIKSIAIEPNSSGRIMVTMQITNTDVKIPKNSVAKIFSSDFLDSLVATLGGLDGVLRSGQRCLYDFENYLIVVDH